jgi:predicted RecB family nuclease
MDAAMSVTQPITASMLYNLVQCPKRVELDLFGNDAERDAISPFVAMLWRRGTEYERDVIARMGLSILDLSALPESDREQATLEAMAAGEPLIYGGRIRAAGLLGIPDLLRFENGGYVPIDIKSGRGEEGGGEDEDGKPKLHYAVQLALYVDILEQLGLSAGRSGIIFDVLGREVVYDLSAPRGVKTPQTMWDDYQDVLAGAKAIVAGTMRPKAALASSCKLCQWRSLCGLQLREDGDLTLIPVLGRALRDAMEGELPNIRALAAADPDRFITGTKTSFKGVGADRFRAFHARAILLTTPGAQPYLKTEPVLPRSRVELFFDIEVDPLRDHTYLHGFVRRQDGGTSGERYMAFFTDNVSADGERDAFAKAIAYMSSEPQATVYYYSKYERTIYRKLRTRYPDVCSEELVESLFDPARAIDLYNDVVVKATEWPTNDQSIKTLAKFLGFPWRDTDPSGAASIEWFDRWVQNRDPEIRQRIHDYNEDDCRATRVLLDGVRKLVQQIA